MLNSAGTGSLDDTVSDEVFDDFGGELLKVSGGKGRGVVSRVQSVADFVADNPEIARAGIKYD